MKKTAFWLLAFVSLLFPPRHQAQSLGWSEIPNTKLGDVCVNGVNTCNGIFAWSSGVFDTMRNRMIIWGGGHNDYAGNEIYALNLNGTPSYERLTDQTATGCSQASCDGGLTPNARHTYDAIEYMANADAMFVYTGALSVGGGAVADTWTFTFADKKWHLMNPSGPLPIVGPGIAMGYDPNSGRIFLTDHNNLYTYTLSTNSYQLVGSSGGSVGYWMVGAVDPVRKKFVVLGGGESSIYDISGTGSYDRQVLTTTGDNNTIKNVSYPGVVYDPNSDRIVAWAGGDTVYSLNLDTKVWTPITYPGGPGAQNQTGTYSRWNYSPALNAFVLVNTMTQNAYTFRISSGPGVPPPPPDAQAPTVSLTAPAGNATISGSVNLSATASDNVGVVGVQFLVDGVGVDSEDTTSPYSVVWNSGTVVNGQHSIAAQARDASGNTTVSSAVIVTTDNILPPTPPELVVALSFDESAGSTVLDLSGKGNSGTIINAARVAGKYANALSFNGVNARVSIPDSLSLHLSAALTMEAWINPAIVNGNWRDIIMKGADNFYLEGTSAGSGAPAAGGTFLGGPLTAPSSLPANTWSHLAATYGDGFLRLYVNGAQVASAQRNTPITISTSPLEIGGDSLWGQFFQGLIDEVRIYNVVRTPAQIQADMNTPIGMPATPPTSGTITVGPGKNYITISEAVAAAHSGSVIEVDSAVYQDESFTINQSNLTIKGVGGRAHIKWGTGDYASTSADISNGKGIVIVNGTGNVLENLEFSGARAAGSNGAGVRYQSGDLTIRNSYFHGNQNGLMGEGGLAATLVVENTVFEQNGYCDGGGGCAHNVYIGNMGRLIFRHNKSIDSRQGHTLKSRAQVNEVLYNFISTKNSDGSYEIDLPNGGAAYVIGNVIEQGANTGNSSILAWGAEGAINPNPELSIVNNTFMNWRSNGATFVQVSGAGALAIKNNIFAGGGVLLAGGTTDLTSNRTSSAFVNAGAGDFHLAPNSDAINTGVDPGNSGSYSLTPLWEYLEPAAKVARTLVGTIDVGAYESNVAPPPSDPCIASPMPVPTVNQWPSSKTGTRQLQWASGSTTIAGHDHRWIGATGQTVKFYDSRGCSVTVTKP